MGKILVTGAHGQLGSELNLRAGALKKHDFVFADRVDFDIADQQIVHDFITDGQFNFVINCAAYTAVDKAETERGAAFKINGDAAGYIAKACKEAGARLIHISTDFVFDGSISRPLLEDDATNPLGVYGASKLEGEKQIQTYCPEAVIVHTAWLYSSFGNNFVKTIIRLCKEKPSLNIIADQVGSPTYAGDLAAAVLEILDSANWVPGVYHYSNEGAASWYDFAIAIRNIAGLTTPINPIETSQYPTPATRPKYSLLNKKKIKATYGLTIPYWRDSLEQCMKLIK